jgi:ketopantoate reductase
VRAGYSVAFIARGAQLEAIRRSGLYIRSPKGDFNVTLAQVTDNPSDVGPVDAVILGVKASQVPQDARAMRPLLAPTTKALPLQNGVEAADQLQHFSVDSILWLVSAGSSVPSHRPATSTTRGLSQQSHLASRTDRLYRQTQQHWQTRCRQPA